MERKNDRNRKEKEERLRGKPSRQEKERERAEKAREKEMQRMEKKQVKLDKEKDRLEKERQRTLQRQAELEEKKGRLCVMDPAKDQVQQTRGPSAKTSQAQEDPTSLPRATARCATLAAAQDALVQCKLEVSSRSSMPGAPQDSCPEDKASDVSFGDDSTSVTDDLTSANIASLERANEQLRLEVEKREGEYKTLQDEVRTLSSKVARLRQQNAADTAAFNQELEGGGASGGVEVEVGELEKTVQDLEQRIVQMESAGDLLAESMETAAIGKWQSLEGEEVVGQQLSDMVDQMKDMLHQASSTPIRLPPPFLPPPKIPIPASTPATTLPLHPHPSGTAPPLQKTSASPNSRSFERTYSHAMKLQVQMNNLRLSQLERNKEILLIKQQLLLQEVNNVLMQASIRRREKDLHQYALARKQQQQQQQAAHLKRWNTFSVQGTNASRPPLLRKPHVVENEGTTTATTGSLPAKRTSITLPATTTAATTTTTPTTPAKPATTASVSRSPTGAKPTIQNAEENGMKTPVPSTIKGHEQSGVQTPLPSTNQEVERSGFKTPVTSTNQRVEEEGVEVSLTSTNQAVENNNMQTPLTSTSQGVEKNNMKTPLTSTNQVVEENNMQTPLTSTNSGVEENSMQTPLTSTNSGVEENTMQTPLTSTNSGVEENSMQTPLTSTNQGMEENSMQTPLTSTNQGMEENNMQTPLTSTNQGVEENNMQTPLTSTNQAVEENNMQTPLTSTKQGVEENNMQTPLTSTNQAVEENNMQTPLTSTNQAVEENNMQTPLTSMNQAVEENNMQTPLTSTNQAVEENNMQTPLTSTKQGVEDNGVETPVTSTNQEVEESGAKTPLAPANQEVEDNGAETPVTSTNQRSEEHDVKTPVMSMNQAVEENSVDTIAASSEDQRKEGRDAETVQTAQHGESNGVDVHVMPDAHGVEEQCVMNPEDICTGDDGSLLETPHAVNPGKLATFTSTCTSTVTPLAGNGEDASTITADQSEEKSSPGTEVPTTSAKDLQEEKSMTAAEPSLEEEVSAVGTSIKGKDVTDGDSTISALKSEDVETCAETSTSLSAENANVDVASVSNSNVEHLEDSERFLSDRLPSPSGPDDSCVNTSSLSGTTTAKADVRSETTATDASAAITPVSSAVTNVTLAETSLSTSTTAKTDADTKDGSITRQTMTDASEGPTTSMSRQQNASDQQQNQQREKGHVPNNVSTTSNKNSGSSTRPEVCLHKALQESRKQNSGTEKRAGKILSSSSTSLHAPHLGHASRVRRLRPATELLQESQRYRSGHSVYSTRIMSRYLPSRSPQPGSPLTAAHWKKEADSRRVCRDGVPLRSPGSSGASSSLSLHRADSPTRAHSELVSHVSHKLSSSGYLAAARLGKPFSSCSTMSADLTSTDPAERAVSGVDEENKTTSAGQALMTTRFSASASSKELLLQGSMPEGERSENRSPAQEKHSTPHISSSGVDSERREQRHGDKEKTSIGCAPDRAPVGQDSDSASHPHSQKALTANSDPTLTAGSERKVCSSDPSKQSFTCGPSIVAVSSEPVSAHVTTETKPSATSDVTKGQAEGKKKSRSKILNISWLQKPKKFFTTSK